MRLVTLVENTFADPALRAEHGLSLYIETEAHKILFDMGQSDVFARNARSLGIDLSQVDLAILSHGHYDHGGGLETFLSINSKAPVYVHRRAFGEYYNGKEKYIGLNQTLCGRSRLIFTEGTVDLLPGMRLTDCNDQSWRFDSWGLSRKSGDIYIPDDFHHEQYLQITEGEKRILISGCSHKGIVNIAEHFRADVLIGGFHLNKQENRDSLEEIAEKLKKTGTMYYTGHCTGQVQFAAMKEIMEDQLERLSTGITVEV